MKLFWVKCRGSYSLEVSVIRAETEEEARRLFTPTSPADLDTLEIEIRELEVEGDPEEVANAVYIE
jgi:alkanesulfonate monooxygenase SsuD/methylene tetrahydromethanopterin reductase-like flavin-dependent oxidoreductase (luciferase family)